MSTSQVGGWSSFNFNISHEARKAFDTALHGFVGVRYKPLAVATQIVAGTNYCFLCEATVVYPGATPHAAKVYIYQPLEGNAHITQIIQDMP